MVLDLLTTTSLRIKHDDSTLVLLVSWVGRQTETTVIDGCWKIHEAMLQYQSFVILNDNRHVVGEWNAMAPWVGTIWLPRMKADGLKRFAWVQSALDLPRASTQLCLEALEQDPDTIKVFKDINKAQDWLAEYSIQLT